MEYIVLQIKKNGIYQLHSCFDWIRPTTCFDLDEKPAVRKQEGGGGEGQWGCKQGGNANKLQKYDSREADVGAKFY